MMAPKLKAIFSAIAVILVIAICALSMRSCKTNAPGVVHDTLTVVTDRTVHVPADTIYVDRIVGKRLTKVQYVTLTHDSLYYLTCPPFAFHWIGTGDTISGIANCADSTVRFLAIHPHPLSYTVHDTTRSVSITKVVQPILSFKAYGAYDPFFKSMEAGVIGELHIGNLALFARPTISSVSSIGFYVGGSFTIWEQ